MVFTTMASALKAQKMRRDPWVSVCIDNEAFPSAFVRVAHRDVRDDRAESSGRRNAVEGERLARIAPSNVIARRGIAD